MFVSGKNPENSRLGKLLIFEMCILLVMDRVSTAKWIFRYLLVKLTKDFFGIFDDAPLWRTCQIIWQYMMKIYFKLISPWHLQKSKNPTVNTRSVTNLNGLYGSKNRKTKRTNFCFGWPRFNCGLFQVIIDCSEEFSSHDLRWYSILFRLYS